MPIINRHARARSGFTLMEILVAAMIMATMLIALGTVIHTSIRAWRVGHGMSEIAETAHITQDVLLRDLNNMIYMPQETYNKVFRNQLQLIANRENEGRKAGRGDAGWSSLRGYREERRERRDRKRNIHSAQEQPATTGDAGQAGGIDPYGGVTLDTIAPPLDLSFHASNSDKTDEISFARQQAARWEGDPETGGVRRVRYYVKDKTLYREETDPYGFRGGLNYTPDPENEYQNTLWEVMQIFVNEHEQAGKEASEPGAGSPYIDPVLKETWAMSLPPRVSYAEPLCEGVEIFDLAFGYFMDGEWYEVEDWDSDASRYRHPPMPEDEELERERRRAGRPVTQAEQEARHAMSMLGQNATRGRNKPDHLPGYLAVQLGVRPTDGRGQLHSFTFYYSVPIAQEDDVYDPDRAEMGFVPQGVQVTNNTGGGSSRGRFDQRRGSFSNSRRGRDGMNAPPPGIGMGDGALPGVPPGWSSGGGFPGSGNETQY